jgi:hypothetical protein
MAQDKQDDAPEYGPAMLKLFELACAQERAAGIARIVGRPGKTVRQRVRDGRIVDPDVAPLPDGKRVALPPVHVSDTGTASLTDAHKRGIALTYAGDEAGAQAIIDGLAQ